MFISRNKTIIMNEFSILTQERFQLIDITEKVEKVVKESGIKDGLVLVFVPHSTAGILLTENEENLKQDWIDVLKKLVSGFDFRHNKIDDNADSHILSGLAGQEKNFPINDGRIVRGIWQQIFLVEFDGPKSRIVTVKIIKG